MNISKFKVGDIVIIKNCNSPKMANFFRPYIGRKIKVNYVVKDLFHGGRYFYLLEANGQVLSCSESMLELVEKGE